MMKTATIVLMFLALTVAFCYGHTFGLGGCPKVKVMKDFDMNKFLGEWFVIGRYNPIATCSKLVMEKNEEGAFMITEESKPFGISFSTEHMPAKKPRKVTILSEGTDSIFKVQQRFAPFGLRTFGVVHTDYEKYALIWGCDSTLIGTVQNLDILSRKPILDSETVIAAKYKADAMGIDVEPLDKVEQMKCEKTDVSNMETGNDFNNMFVEPEKVKDKDVVVKEPEAIKE